MCCSGSGFVGPLAWAFFGACTGAVGWVGALAAAVLALGDGFALSDVDTFAVAGFEGAALAGALAAGGVAALAVEAAAFGRAFTGADLADFSEVVATFAVCAAFGVTSFAFGSAGADRGVLFGGVFCATDALGLAGVAGVDGDLGMEVVLGGTCFADAAAT